ncbi:unnamed protein product [Natator depressus]
MHSLHLGHRISCITGWFQLFQGAKSDVLIYTPTPRTDTKWQHQSALRLALKRYSTQILFQQEESLLEDKFPLQKEVSFQTRSTLQDMEGRRKKDETCKEVKH